MSNWVSNDDLKKVDRRPNTKSNHKVSLNKWKEYMRTSKDDHGFGIQSYSPKMKNSGGALLFDELTDERICGVLTYYYNTICVGSENNGKGSLRNLKSYISYCIKANGKGEDLKQRSDLFPDACTTWNGIMEREDMKNHKGEKAPSFTTQDLDEIDRWKIRNSLGQIHRDWLRRKLAAKLSTTTLNRGGKLHDYLRGDIVENTVAKPGRICLMLSTAYTKTHKTKQNHPVCCECGSDNSFPLKHNINNEDCIITLFRLYNQLIDHDEATYCSKPRNRQKEQEEDWLWRRVGNKKGQKHKKDLPDELVERVILRQKWGPNGPYGFRRNNEWVDKQLTLSISRGENEEANNNKSKKQFRTHTGKRSGMKRNHIYGNNVSLDKKMLLSDHQTERQYYDYFDGMKSVKAAAAFEIADEVKKRKDQIRRLNDARKQSNINIQSRTSDVPLPINMTASLPQIRVDPGTNISIPELPPSVNMPSMSTVSHLPSMPSLPQVQAIPHATPHYTPQQIPYYNTQQMPYYTSHQMPYYPQQMPYYTPQQMDPRHSSYLNQNMLPRHSSYMNRMSLNDERTQEMNRMPLNDVRPQEMNRMPLNDVRPQEMNRMPFHSGYYKPQRYAPF